MNVKCEICRKEYKNNKGLSTHIRYKHNIDSKTYYDTYLKSKKEGICPVCGKETPFLKLSKGYQICYSLSCGTINSRDKARRTTKERYGNPYYNNRDKYNKTINDKYGVDNISQSKEIKEKKKQTSLNHYGVDNPAKADEVKNKTKQSNLDKYGYEYTLQVPEIREKSTKTLMNKYGVEHPLQNKDIKSKQEQTCINRFGVANIYELSSLRDEINKNKYKEATDYAKKHNLSFVYDLVDKYGTGWYQAKVVPLIKYKGITYVENTNILKIEQYIEQVEIHQYSINEKKIVEDIHYIYNGEIIENSRKIIPPKEIDIYLPELKIGIEYNGTYWHSSQQGVSEDYHLNKSLLCRKKGIRLIHIYEFENFNKQLSLLKDLIGGKDKYPKRDFNKNNLIKSIPNPCIIYNDLYHTVYGAGKLY